MILPRNCAKNDFFGIFSLRLRKPETTEKIGNTSTCQINYRFGHDFLPENRYRV